MSFIARRHGVCLKFTSANSESVYILYSTIFCNYYFEKGKKKTLYLYVFSKKEVKGKKMTLIK